MRKGKGPVSSQHLLLRACIRRRTPGGSSFTSLSISRVQSSVIVVENIEIRRFTPVVVSSWTISEPSSGTTESSSAVFNRLTSTCREPSTSNPLSWARFRSADTPRLSINEPFRRSPTVLDWLGICNLLHQAGRLSKLSQTTRSNKCCMFSTKTFIEASRSKAQL